MAIVRIYGGRDGIVDYLRNGKKIGRSLSRDQLDERVVLAGDLDLTDAILRSMDSPGQKFLHVTIAMKEDSLPIDVLKRITNDFEKFAFAAYSHDEYSLYAEAHLPRTKSLLNHDNGADIARLPHIHFVIPQINLVTGRRLDPFGLTERCIKYIDAWQEKTNHRYGLASPKDNFRTAFVDRSDIYLRANDRVPSAAQALKSKVLDAALAEEFWSPDSFVKFLNQFGPVNIHHAGQKNEYFSIKPASSRTRVRLTENVFSRSFLRLPAGQKENFVADTYGPNELAKADLKDRFLAGLDACKQSFSADPNGRRQLKDQILEEVLERDIRSTHAFRTMLSSFGEIRTRNAGRDNAYENVRPTGSIKGVNLKDFCFSEAFFQLSKADKIDHLERRESDRYLEAGAPRQPSEQLLATLDEWQRIGAREKIHQLRQP